MEPMMPSVYTIEGSSGLGDVICFRWEQRAAKQAVLRLQSVFASLGKPVAYAAAVKAITDEWDYYDRFTADWTLCSAKAVGQRAEALTTQMLGSGPKPSADANLQPGALERTTATVGTALKIVAGVATLGIVAWGGITIYRATRRRPVMAGAMRRRRRGRR
jgi:hypothetical protein